MAKARTSRTVSVEVESQAFSGTQIIEGTRKLYQSIEYNGRTKHDGHPYKPGEDAYMNSIARIILGEIVRESGDCQADDAE